jgi:hypothetical protein
MATKTLKLSDELSVLSQSMYDDKFYQYSDAVDDFLPKIRKLEGIEQRLRVKRVELEKIRIKYYEALENSKNIKNFGYGEVGNALSEIARQITLIDEAIGGQ